ncbi:hypothetical protein Brsp07_04605 [Brucella sp. NBRC 14130]|uniref:hypothetical protein n=1 Tax=Brucella sp. NBRC 14130 TaxID=3075483 RepID=UPI0030979ED1
MADWSEQDYENLVTQYGQRAVDEAEDALAAMEAAGRWVSELERPDPQQQPDGGYYSSEDDLKQQRTALARAERSLERTTERVRSLLKADHPALKAMVAADAELSAHFSEALIEGQRNREAQRLADSIVSLSQQHATAPRLVDEIDAAAVKAGNLGARQIEALTTAEEDYRRELFNLARAGFEERRQAASEANAGMIFEDRALNPGLSEWLEAEAGYMAVLDDRDAMRKAYGQGNPPSPQEWSRLEDRIVAAKMTADIARSGLRETVNPTSNDKALFAAVRALGLTISKREDEYRITQPNLSRERSEAVAYYTSDRADAWGTASAMARSSTPGTDATPGSAANPIQIGHTAEQQLRYAVSSSAAVEASEVEALRHQFARTDFNYPYSDDPTMRDRGRKEVEAAKEAFETFAARSPAHAAAASAEWDRATDLITPPKGYVREADRAAEVSANEEAKRLADNIVSLAARHAAAQPVPGTPEAPIQIGHTAEQQLRYSQRRNGREIFQSDPDPQALFDELYSDVTRTADSIPLGALERHAEARLQQSYAVLALIEQARAYGILPEAANFEATGAQVQDKRAQRDFPAAHRLPCDMKLVEPNGRENRLSDFFEIGLHRAWIEGNIFAPTDRVHRMVNVADQWCEDAGMKRSLVDASNAVLHGRMTANEAMEKVIKPGYQEAIAKATAKVERNFSFMERQALAFRIVDRDGQPYKSVDPKLTLKVKGLESRAAAKDAIERTLKAYGSVQDVSFQQRMQTVSSVSAIVENERRLAMGTKSGRRNELTPGTARVEAVLAQEEAEQRLAKEMAAIKQLAAKAQQAANAAQDVTRPMSARAQALGDAATYSEHMKVAWATLQQKTGPQIMKRLEGRLSGTGPHAEAPRLKISAALQTPLPEMRETAERIETLRERFEHDERRDRDRRHQYDHRPGYGPTMN